MFEQAAAGFSFSAFLDGLYLLLHIFFVISKFDLDEGQVWVCGANNSGQLGQGDIETRTRPVAVPVFDNREAQTITRISAGAFHLLMIDCQFLIITTLMKLR